MKRVLLRLLALLLLAAPTALGGCTVNPATGERAFTGFMSEQDELRAGREAHAQILEEFGGPYDNPELARYVSSIGRLLASTSERPDRDFTFTIIDSPIMNAFATPGGYVYVTRGLLALAGNEAELAGVLAHEIGHITGRHAAQRYSKAVLANLGLVGLGIATGSGELVNLAGAGAALYLQGYSREQEFEADLLGVRYLARATYDPEAMASFLEKMEAYARLQAQIEGRPEAADAVSLMSTHPRTADRVRRAIKAAGGAQVANPLLERDLYLDKIDGLLFGDDPKEGLIRGRAFAHPVLRFAFEVPQGFQLYNGRNHVTARGPQGAAIIFDRAPRPPSGSLPRYLAETWGRNIALEAVEPLQVNGMEAATGLARVQTSQGPTDIRLVAVRYDPGTVYRFVFVTPPALTDRLATELQRTTYSFRKLSEREAAALRPQRLRVVTVQPGDSVASLARRLPFDNLREERFRVLNGLRPGQEVRPGDRVKIVVE